MESQPSDNHSIKNFLFLLQSPNNKNNNNDYNIQEQQQNQIQQQLQQQNSDSLKKPISKKKKIKKSQKVLDLNSNLQSNKITNYFTKRKFNEESTMIIYQQNINTVTINRKFKNTDQVLYLQNNYEKLTDRQNQLKQIWEQQRIKYEEKKKQIENYKKKSSSIIGNLIKETYQIKRIYKGKIDSSLGYYRQNLKQFVQGNKKSSIIQLKQSIQQSLKSQNLPQYSRTFLNQQLQDVYKQEIYIKQELQEYKNNQRIYLQQQNSKFCKQNWPLIFKQYQTLQLLGKGGFSQVYKAYDIINDNYVAVKLSSAQGIHLNNVQNYMKYMNRQCQIHKKLDHPNIAKVQQTFQCENQTIITIMQYCQGPELFKYMKDHQFLPQFQAKNIIKQLFEVLVYLSRQNPKIIHYDLKPQNIMFHQGIIKVLDFGLAKIIQQGRTNTQMTTKGVGTYWYLPPQVFKQNEVISNKVDVWSLGVIFYQMIYGQKPFGNNMNQTQIFSKGAILAASQVKFPKNLANLSNKGKQFIKKCLTYDQQKRISPQQALADDYLNY